MARLFGRSFSMLALADEVAERLARLEEQMRYVVTALEHLSGRDTELEARLRELSDRFNQALTAHADSFRASLNEITNRFVSRDDWAFWKNLLTAALLGLLAYGWSTLSGVRH